MRPPIPPSRERSWSWLFIYPPGGAAGRGWSADQGPAKNESSGYRFDIRIGGQACAASPDHLDLYELTGTIRGDAGTATLAGLDTDERPSRYTGKLVTNRDGEHVSLTGRDGSAILLYAAAEKHGTANPDEYLLLAQSRHSAA